MALLHRFMQGAIAVLTGAVDIGASIQQCGNRCNITLCGGYVQWCGIPVATGVNTNVCNANEFWQRRKFL